MQHVFLDGESLTPADVVAVSKGCCTVELAPQVLELLARSRAVIDDILKSEKVVYGVNTGFGNFATTVIPHDQLCELQENLIRSHAAGCGDPLTPERVRMLLVLRINTLCRGSSGIRPEVVLQMVAALNASCLSHVPCRGTVGASGDLAPLAHLALGLMGEGRMWSPTTGWGLAADVLRAHSLQPIKLAAKEGLACINGTQFITAFGCEAIERARSLLKTALFVYALALETLKGSVKALDLDLHRLKPHPGQLAVVRLLHQVLPPRQASEINESHKCCNRVQDAYTLRCVPQVYGVVHDTIEFSARIIQTEINSSTDNPIVLLERGELLSGGNFHGEYPAKALDYLAIAVGELGNMVERRIDRLCSPGLSQELPAFLVPDGGLNSGFMMAHVACAALVAENRGLSRPASSDSIPTSAAKEDHVSMGGYAGRKAVALIRNVEQIVAVELLAACQALDLVRPLRTTEPLEALHRAVRAEVCPMLTSDRVLSVDMERALSFVQAGRVIQVVSPWLDAQAPNS